MGTKKKKIKNSLFCDSQNVLHIPRNLVFHSKIEKIWVQYHFVREVVEEGIVNMKKIHTNDNLVDALIKPINTDKFSWYKSSYGLEIT